MTTTKNDRLKAIADRLEKIADSLAEVRVALERVPAPTRKASVSDTSREVVETG
jgi:hypothetical protein